MYWRKGKLQYQILIPPINKPFYEFTHTEAKEFFRWYIQQIPTRIEYLSVYAARKLGVDISEFDLSPQSLILVWRWFLKTARIERTPEAQLKAYDESYKDLPDELRRHFNELNKEQLSLETEYILRDIAMYIGEVFVKNNPSIYWDYYEKTDPDIDTNKPLLCGFKDSSFNPPFSMFFEPVHMVRVQASNIFDDTQHDDDLLKLYDKWCNWITKDNNQ